MSRLVGLRALLEQLFVVDPAVQEFVARSRVLLEAGDSAFRRDHFVPGHITASSFVVDPTGTKVLLLFHSKLGRWLQPGGHVEESDADIEAAARREVREETGLVELRRHPRTLGLFDVDVHPIPAWKSEPAHAHFDVRFLFVAPDLEVHDPEGAQVRWFNLGEVFALGGDASVERAVRRIRRLNSAC